MISNFINYFVQILLNSFKKIQSYINFDDTKISKNSIRINQRIKQIFLSGSTNIFYKFITIGITLISIPLTLNYLGSERFGMWMICSSIMSFIVIGDFGLANSLINSISKNEVMKNHLKSKYEISSIFFVLIIISLILSIIFCFLYFNIKWENFFNVKSSIAKKESYQLILVVYVLFIVNLPLGIIQKIQVGLQQSHKNNIWLSLGGIISFAAILTSIYLKLGSPWLIGSLMIGPLIANILNGLKLFILERRDLSPSFRYLNIKFIKSSVKRGFVLFLIQIGSITQYSADIIIIAQILGSEAVAPYAIAKKMFIMSQIQQSFMLPLWPAFNEAILIKEYKWAKNFLKKVIKKSITLGVFFALPILLFGEFIAELWTNNNFNFDIYLLLGLFLWTIYINFSGPLAMYMSNNLYVKRQLIMVLFATVGTLILQIILCKIYGIKGVIFGTIIPNIIFFILPASKLVFQDIKFKKN